MIKGYSMAFLFKALPALFSSPLTKNIIGAASSVFLPIVKQAGSALLGKAGELAINAIGGLANKAVDFISSKITPDDPKTLLMKREAAVEMANDDWDDDPGVTNSSIMKRKLPPNRRKRIKNQ